MSRHTEKMLDNLQKKAFGFFLQEHNPDKGLVRDKSDGQSPASIAVIGFALASYIVAIERGFMKRNEAVKRTLAVVRFFSKSLQSTAARRNGLQRVLLSFSRHGKRPAHLDLRIVNH